MLRYSIRTSKFFEVYLQKCKKSPQISAEINYRICSSSYSIRVSTNVPKDMICDYFIYKMILIANKMTFELAPLPIVIIIVTISIPCLEAKLSFFI